MKIDLAPYSNKKICVAVSGGRDSMALLHYINAHSAEYNIALSALNCDHAMRGEASKKDSEFVKNYCKKTGVPLTFFKAEEGAFKSENDARGWRLECYKKVLEKVDFIATAHHLNDNAETVLFNLARGSSLAGMTGITDEPSLRLIRPMIACSRGDIDGYIKENNLPFVVDESNFTLDYTRNKIRANVLPALEQAVPGAAGAIYRFSRLAAEDEEYFARKVDGLLIYRKGGGYLIKPCEERVIFKRAVTRILRENKLKDFTAAQLESVYELQGLSVGKRFCFLGLTAVKEEGGVAIIKGGESFEHAFGLGETDRYKVLLNAEGQEGKVLVFDLDKIPAGAVVRTRREGDRITKFGGGTKSLSDYLTDKKVPQALRDKLPLVCNGSDVLIVGGVDISDVVKVTADTARKAYFISFDINE